MYWLLNIFNGFQRAARVIKNCDGYGFSSAFKPCCVGSWVLSRIVLTVYFLKMKLQKDGILNNENKY